MMKLELVKKLKDYFNLNIYETNVWLALLSKGMASAGEIAEISGVPRSRTYDVLEGLEKKGFAIEKIGKPVKYLSVKPTVVLERLKKQEMDKAEEKIESLETMKESKEYEELEALHNSSVSSIKLEEMSRAIRGEANILSHAKEIIDSAENEIIISVPACFVIEKARWFNDILERIKKKGLLLKLALNGNEEDFKKITMNHKISFHKTEFSTKTFIADRKQVLFSLTNPSSNREEMAVWFNSEFFSNAIASMLENSMKR